MSIITSIETQVKDKERCNIYIDGRFYCGIKLEVVIKNRLKVGMEMDKKQLDELQLQTECSQALDRAMTHLSARMKTKKEMSEFLLKKGYTQLVVDTVIEKLSYYNLVNDEAYSRAYVNSISGKGKKAIELALLKKGVGQSEIEEALSEYEEDEEEVYRMIEKYMRGKANTKENIYKAFKYLLSKGYDYDVVNQVVAKYREEHEDDSF